jgi:AbrB family looped-hinge helix DNA binding protein
MGGLYNFIDVLYFKKRYNMAKMMTVGPKGQVVIPAALRKELGIEPGDKVMLERVEDTLKISSRKAVIARLRGAFADIPGSLSEELLAERRAEAEAKGW